MKAANLVLRFALELAAIAALIRWGLDAGASTATEILLAVAAAGLFIAVWGRWIAPKAANRLQDPARLIAELAIFAVAAAALAIGGHTALAIGFAILVAANELLLLAWGQRETA
jgi:hypothetical protein